MRDAVHSDILHREQLTTRHLGRVPQLFLLPSVICSDSECAEEYLSFIKLERAGESHENLTLQPG